LLGRRRLVDLRVQRLTHFNSDKCESLVHRRIEPKPLRGKRKKTSRDTALTTERRTPQRGSVAVRGGGGSIVLNKGKKNRKGKGPQRRGGRRETPT